MYKSPPQPRNCRAAVSQPWLLPPHRRPRQARLIFSTSDARFRAGIPGVRMTAMGRKPSLHPTPPHKFNPNSPIATGSSSALLCTASPVAPNHIKPSSTSKRHLHPHGDIAPQQRRCVFDEAGVRICQAIRQVVGLQVNLPRRAAAQLAAVAHPQVQHAVAGRGGFK